MTIRLQCLCRLTALSMCWTSCALLLVEPATSARAADPASPSRWSWNRNRNERDAAPRRVTAAATRDQQQSAAAAAAAAARGGAQAPLNEDGESEELATVRLNFAAADWSKVLNDVAKATGSTLVMLDTPPGRFSRTDWTQRTRTEAVRILNRELEPKGYRIVERDQFLTVLGINRSRVEYARPEFAADEPRSAADAGPPQVVQAAGHSAAGQPGQRPPAQGRNIQLVSEEVPATAPERAPADAVLTRSFLPTTRSALDLSGQVHRAFQKRSRLVDAGRTGRPGFQVSRPARPGAPAPAAMLFEVEFDTEEDEIFIHAPQDVADRVATLFQNLDAAARAEGVDQAVRFLPEEGNTAEVATRLQPTLIQLAQFRQGARGAGAARDPETIIDPARPPARDGQSVRVIPEDVLDEVRGEVSIQNVEGVGLVIIGNQRDVDAVSRIIQSVERMAVGSLPQIELYHLQNVDSESLSVLLTTVYEQLSTIRNRGQTQAQAQPRQLAIIPVVTPNALLILAPENALDSIFDLIEQLDQPVDPDSEITVFRLKYAVATQVVTHLTNFYATRPGLGTTVRAVADVRTNSVIVQARPRNLSEITRLIEEIDQDTSEAVLRGVRYQLQYASAAELSQFMSQTFQALINPQQQALQQGGFGGAFGGAATQGPQELRDSKAVVLEFLRDNRGITQMVRSGLLSDIRITPEPRTNSLLIAAPEQSLPLVEAIIEVLDQPSAAVSDIKMFPLKNADALATVTLLQQLFQPQQQQQQGVGVGGAFGQLGQGPLGLQIIGATDTTSLLVPMQFSADPRTNTVFAVGGPDALRIVEALLLRLDSADSRNRRTEVLKLRNTPAADIAASINTFLQGLRDLSTLDPDRITVNQILDQEVIVTAEPVMNNLLISATPRYFDDILRVARELDREPEQVMIQAVICEVLLSGDCEFGVELGFQDPVLFSRSNPTTNLPGFLFNNLQLGNQPVNPASVGSQGLSSFALGRTSSELGFGGLVLAASSESVSVLIRALQAHSNVQILSRPSVLAIDNQVAEITAGQLVPRPQGVVVTQNIVSPDVQDTEVGILLSVIPRITPEGMVIMQLIANKSEVSGVSVPIFTDTTTGNVISSPIINQSRATTTIKVPDGQTVVVGGIITSNDNTSTRKVPWLGDLPVIGHAFRYDQKRNDRTELIIFLTPRVVRRDIDSEIIKQVESERLHYFIEDVEAMHGPLFGVPKDGWSGDPNCPPEMILPQGVEGGLLLPGELPPGAILPDGTTVGTERRIDTMPKPPLKIYDPATNSHRIQTEYGDWYGRRPLPH
ncbi:MAG: hypothetical protein KF774_18630 [Planctomyces sp.]|nr:hypothetical protein [Planctomyces sp.]